MVPCPTCGKDTLHFALKCSECGTVTHTAAEKYRETRERIRSSPAVRRRIAMAFVATRDARRQAAVDRFEEYERFRSNPRKSVFGSGRERHKA